MFRDNRYDSPIDERCRTKSSDADYKPRHPWADAVDEDCVPIPDNDKYKSRHLVEEPKPARRPDPIPNDWLEKGAHYDPEGNLVPPEGIYDDPIIPEEVDDF